MTFSHTIVFITSTHNHQKLHSFPTRRSSDLKNMKCIREFSKSPIPKKYFLVSHPINVSIMVYQFYKNERKRRYLILRSEEHTSELQSPCNIVCRLLLEKKK